MSTDLEPPSSSGSARTLRDMWSKGGEPLHEWLDRELLATPVDDTTGVTTRGSTP
jgi:hypothetical protein